MNPSIRAGHFDGLSFTDRAEKPTETPTPPTTMLSV